MKHTFRFLALLFACALSIAAEAQIMTTSSLVVRREKRPPLIVSPGYQQSVELNSSLYIAPVPIAAEYQGGYRFNNTFYAGFGIGLAYLEDRHATYKDDYTKVKYGYLDYLALPLHIDGRAYLGKRWIKPYFGLALGGLFPFAKAKHSAPQFRLEPQFGVDFVMRSGNSIYFSVAYTYSTKKQYHREYYEYVDDYYELQTGYNELYNSYDYHSFTLHIGFTFGTNAKKKADTTPPRPRCPINFPSTTKKDNTPFVR